MNDSALKRTTLVVAMITSFITPFMGAAANIALPRISADLNMDAVLLSWVASSYILAAAVFLLPAGRLADILGRERIQGENLPDFLKGMHLLLVIFTALLVAGVFASLARGGVHGQKKEAL